MARPDQALGLEGGRGADELTSERTHLRREGPLELERFAREPARGPPRRLVFRSLLVLPRVLGALVADLLITF